MVDLARLRRDRLGKVQRAMAVHGIPCTHDEMARPEFLSAIGALLKEAL